MIWNNDLEDFWEFVNYAKSIYPREVGPRRYLRDFSDPFRKYSTFEFTARYRFTPRVVKDILVPRLLDDLGTRSKRGLPFAPEIKVLVTLRYFATGKTMDEDTMNICQQSVSRIITQVSRSLATKMKEFVKFPATVEEINAVKEKFYKIAQFPGVIGCIGCTHIKIKSPGGANAEVYRNSKGFFSINVQAVVGPNLDFYDLVVRWPGSTDNSVIYDCSAVKHKLNRGILQGVLLGDSGYAVSDQLMTPFLSPNSPAQQNYNRSLIRTRNTIETAFGVWKKRFPCLQERLTKKLDTVVAVICACATLHNLSLAVQDLLLPLNEDDMDVDMDDEPVTDPLVNENENGNGFVARQSLVERFFS